MGDVIYRRITDRLDDPQLIRLIDNSLDDEDLCRFLEEVGLAQAGTSRSGLLRELARGCRSDPRVGHALVQTLMSANEELVHEIKSLDTAEIGRRIADAGKSRGEAGRVAFALLADDRPEVHRMAREVSESSVDGLPVEPVDAEALCRLYEELMRELEQARQERAELIRLIKDLRGTMRDGVTSGAASSSAEAPRVGLFVDVQNIFYNARNFYGRKLDFKKLMEMTTQGRQLVTAVAYLVFSPDVDQTNFVTMLQQNGYSVREKLPRRQAPADDSVASRPSTLDDDLPMHLDILNRLDGMDLAILVGSDGDILGLAQRIRSAGPRVELYAFAQNIPDDVAHTVDHFCPIDESLLLSQEYTPRQQQPYYNPSRAAANPSGRGTRGYGVGQRQQRSWSSDPRT